MVTEVSCAHVVSIDILSLHLGVMCIYLYSDYHNFNRSCMVAFNIARYIKAMVTFSSHTVMRHPFNSLKKFLRI